MDPTDEDKKWEFDMPKFFDFTNTNSQERPDERWFSPAHVSGPSFPLRKKSRALRLHKKPAEPQDTIEKPPPPESPKTNVFDRLSRLSTISFSNKTQQNSSESRRRSLKRHVSQSKPQQHTDEAKQEQYQLDEDTQKESVAERIARIEKDILKKNHPLKRKFSNSGPFQQNKIQKILDSQYSGHDSSRTRKTQQAATSSQEQLSPTTKPHSIHSESQNLSSQPKEVHTTTSLQDKPSKYPSPARTHRSLFDELQNSSSPPRESHFSSLQDQAEYKPPSPIPTVKENPKETFSQEQDTSTSDFFNNLMRSKPGIKNNHAPPRSPDIEQKSSLDIDTRSFFDSIKEVNNSKQRNSTIPEEQIQTTSRPFSSKPIQVYRDTPEPQPTTTTTTTTTTKKAYFIPDSTYFKDEKIRKARNLLKASRERTQKWMQELSVNQPLSRSQVITKSKK